jgi:ketosteroid isomerase-like protein
VSKENVEIVRTGLEAWNRGDFDQSLAEMAPDVVWRTSGVIPDLETEYRGHDAVREFWRAWTGSWDHIRIATEKYVDLGDQVVVLATFHARSRDDIAVDQPIAFLFTVTNGRLSAFQSYWERKQLYADIDPRLFE